MLARVSLGLRQLQRLLHPLTYLGKNGKQYVALVATDTLLVYALP